MIFIEVAQVKALGLKYFTDIGNISDMILYVLLITKIISLFSYENIGD